MKRYEYYNGADIQKPELNYPKKPARPNIKPNASSQEIMAYAGLVKEYEGKLAQHALDVAAYNEARKPYNKMISDRAEEFKKDLFEECGVTDNPKADNAYSIAYEYGHSSGFAEIATHFFNIVELIK